MHYVGGVGADHHKYIILGIDLDVVKEQSRKQADKGESSYLHWHAADVSCYGTITTATATLPCRIRLRSTLLPRCNNRSA